MTCPYIPDLSYSDFRTRMRDKLANQRLPLSGSLELNFRCNLRCQHCYVAHGHTGLPGKRELSLVEIKRIIDEIVEAGCLWLLLTGGEVFLRGDFKDIYRYAREKGLLVTLFSNGTLLTPGLVDFLAENRPFNLEISLYGWTKETYERVTGIPGSHRRCYDGIARLKEKGVPFRLKTVLMSENWHELKDMQTFAESLGAAFRFDPLINGGLEGEEERKRTGFPLRSCGNDVGWVQPSENGFPLKPRENDVRENDVRMQMRLPAEQVVQIEREDVQFGPAWRQMVQRYSGWRNENGLLYQCSAGMTSFHIDPYGQLSMCMMARQRSYDLRQGTFQHGWDEFLKHERSLRAPQGHLCSQCNLQPVCSACPGWSYTEHGDSVTPVDYLCQVTHLRAEAFGSAA